MYWPSYALAATAPAGRRSRLHLGGARRLHRVAVTRASGDSDELRESSSSQSQDEEKEAAGGDTETCWLLQLAEEILFCDDSAEPSEPLSPTKESAHIFWRMVLKGNDGPPCCFSPEEVSSFRALNEGEDFNVSISVYDFMPMLNWVLIPSGLGGAYHCGLVIGAREWSFFCTESGTGVLSHAPCEHPGYVFREKVYLKLGKELKVTSVMALLAEMRGEYRGRSYELKSRNCLTFSQDLARRLGAQGFPEWLCLPTFVSQLF